HRDLVAGLGRLGGREDGAGGDVDREYAETGAQDGTEDFVHFKGVHRLKARAEGRGNWKRPRQIAAVHKYPDCLGHGNPYKRPTTQGEAKARILPASRGAEAQRWPTFSLSSPRVWRRPGFPASRFWTSPASQ